MPRQLTPFTTQASVMKLLDVSQLLEGAGLHMLVAGEATMIPPVTRFAAIPSTPRALRLERVLNVLSILTIVMTIPQVIAVWVRPGVSGVSLVSWMTYFLAACFWFVYGIEKRDKSIYLPCIGWILLDAAIVIGVVIHR